MNQLDVVGVDQLIEPKAKVSNEGVVIVQELTMEDGEMKHNWAAAASLVTAQSIFV